MINLNACIRSAFEHDANRSETLFKPIICPSCVFISYFNIDILMSLSSMKWLWFVSAHLVCQRRASQSITSLFLFHFLLTLITWRILYDSKHEARQKVYKYVNESVLDPLSLCGRSQFVVARL